MLFDRWDSLLLKIIVTVEYVQWCNREEFWCFGAVRVVRQGMATASQGVRKALGRNGHLNFKGQVEIEQVENGKNIFQAARKA